MKKSHSKPSSKPSFDRSELTRILERAERPQKINTWLIAGIGVVLLIVLLLWLAPSFSSGGMSESAFIKSANACTPAQLTKTISTTTFTLEIKDGCVLTKRIISMAPSEPQEVRDLFVGSDMTCTYTQGQFDTNYVNQISGNLAPCTGPLVDAILTVI